MAPNLDLPAPKPVPRCCIVVLLRQRAIVLLEEEQPPLFLLLVLLMQIPALADVLAGCYVSGSEPGHALASLSCKFQNAAPAPRAVAGWTLGMRFAGRLLHKKRCNSFLSMNKPRCIVQAFLGF